MVGNSIRQIIQFLKQMEARGEGWGERERERTAYRLNTIYDLVTILTVIKWL